MGGEANLTSSNVESASSVSKPTLGQSHVLTSTNVTATSEVSKPILAEGSFALTSSNVEAGSSVKQTDIRAGTQPDKPERDKRVKRKQTNPGIGDRAYQSKH